MAQENVLQIQKMIEGLDAERMADLLMQQNPDLDPNDFEPAPQLPQGNQFDAFASAIGTPESGLRTPNVPLPDPSLFRFGNPAQPQVTLSGTQVPQIQFPRLFGG